MDVTKEYRAYDLWPEPALAPAPLAPPRQYHLWCPRCGRGAVVTSAELKARKGQGQMKCCRRQMCCLLLPTLAVAADEATGRILAAVAPDGTTTTATATTTDGRTGRKI